MHQRGNSMAQRYEEKGVTMMDAKEQRILCHYKKILECREFDEYDILGFLIFIRGHLDRCSTYTYIREFADLIAHRNRNKGIILECIKVCIENNYQTEKNNRTVVGYHGLDRDEWVRQWMQLGEKFDISIDENMIREITLCIFSLAQHTQYDNHAGISGKVSLFQGNDRCLALATSSGTPDSLYVCFAKLEDIDFVRNFSAGYIEKPVETVRENGNLRLRDEDGYII